MTAKQFLAERVLEEKDIRDYLGERMDAGSRYDGELGWTLRDGVFVSGINDAVTFQHIGADGSRQTIQFVDKPYRINTYGNSFTQGAQVNDGETWQEVLAAHLGEPIRNYGVGSYSVYQAYLRMLKEEEKYPAEFIVFGIYDDDHFRSLDAWQGIRHEKIHHSKFDKVLWITSPYIEIDTQTGSCREKGNPCPTPDDLYMLSDTDRVYETFKDDLVLEIMLAHVNAGEPNPHIRYNKIEELGKPLGIVTAENTLSNFSPAAEEVHTRYALKVTEFVVSKVEEFAEKQGKRVLYVIFPRSKNVAIAVDTGTRFDQSFVDFLEANNLPYVDLLEAQIRDFQNQNRDIKAYLQDYYISHYSPLGNFFAAHTIRDHLVKILNPKPPAYRLLG